jgi:hypothetical protein
MSMEGSLDGSIFADVLKPESRLRLLKLDNAIILIRDIVEVLERPSYLKLS